MPSKKPVDNEQKSSNRNFTPNFMQLTALLVLVVSVVASFYFWQEARNARSQTPESVAARNQEESQAVVNALGKILVLDTENEPTVAKIENPDVLREANADFYKNAEVDDYLVLYPQRAIIYREEDNKLINIAPIINTEDIQAQSEDPVDDESSQNLQ